MLRSLSFYSQGVFADEQFENLVAVLVAAAFMEVLLWIGVQLAGYRGKEGGTKNLTLGTLIRKAKSYDLIDKDLKRLLKMFNAIRNDFAHNIDYKMTPDTVSRLRSLLPDANEQGIRLALANVPEASNNLIARLVIEQTAELAYGAVRAFAVREKAPVTQGGP